MTEAANFIWTEERVEMVRRMWADGISAGKIAAAIGAPTRNIVIGKVYRMGFTRPPAPSKPVYVPPAPKLISLPQAAPPVDLEARRPPKALKRDVFTAPDGAYLVTIHELRQRGDCRWPFGVAPPYQYCGKPATDGSYCCEHGRIAFSGADRPNLKAFGPGNGGRGLQMEARNA